MEWEKLATSAVRTEISKTDRLSSFIADGDKEPCWDGYIYIHEGKNHTKKNLKRVAVQVKGKSVNESAVEEVIKFRISKDDLQAYMMNGGTLFFVVYLDKETGNTLQIYYAELLPFTIQSIIREEQESYLVNFYMFPEDNFKKTELFLNFYENAQKQTSFAGRNLPTIEELTKSGLLESLTFRYTGYGTNLSQRSLPKIIDGKSLTLYANLKGGVAAIPVEHFESVHQFTMSNENSLPVCVGGVKYYDSYKVVTTADKVELHIGSCVRVIFPNTEEKIVPVTVKIKIKGKLKEQILGIEFVMSMIEQGTFFIGEHEFLSKISDEELEKLGVTEFPKILEGYKRVQALLDSMNVKKDLDIQNCTEEDFRKLNLLIGAIEERRPVKEHPEDVAELVKMDIANLNLAVLYLRNASGNYNIWDYFGNRFEVSYKTDEEDIVRVSQFSNMVADDFLSYDNINLKLIVEDYKKLEHNEYLYGFGNAMMLEMLKAYDRKPSQELLDAVKDLSEWISSGTEFLDSNVIVLNRLQIVLRERELTFEEKSILHNIVMSGTEDLFKIGALLLLDEQYEAKIILDTLDEVQKRNFMDFPIFKFYKHPDEGCLSENGAIN